MMIFILNKPVDYFLYLFVILTMKCQKMVKNVVLKKVLFCPQLGMLMINRLIAIKNLTDNRNVVTDDQQRVFCVLFLQI